LGAFFPFWTTKYLFRSKSFSGYMLASPMSTSKFRVAILDDYQQVALTSADWSSVRDRLAIDVFTNTILSEDLLVKRLEPYTIICAMRERTKFCASLLDRLPNLKLIATTGRRNAAIDIAHAKEKGIVVSGAQGMGNSTLEHIWALILAMGLSGRTLGLVGVGRLGSRTAKVSSRFITA